MKNASLLLAASLLFAAASNAQSTADSIRSKYQLQTMPQALTVEKTFPVLGTYQLTAANGTMQNVAVTLDPENKGIIWVEGFPEGKFKAYLRKAPGTYRILSQKSESGRQVPEGTLLFDGGTNTLNVALGRKYDNADPTAIFNMNGSANADVADATEVKIKTKKGTTKTKAKVMFYTATRAQVETSTSTGAAMQ